MNDNHGPTKFPGVITGPIRVSDYGFGCAIHPKHAASGCNLQIVLPPTRSRLAGGIGSESTLSIPLTPEAPFATYNRRMTAINGVS